ncbi:hypothetical protein BC835DRAFT_1416490 [Cytidiella melzeri]|nr:hypothetical protein BC835DRAFT_1416490 [Cytidiella melzeri]
MASTQHEPMDGIKTFPINFPPFPTPPPGVTIIPFTKFKPLGIAVSIEADSAEVEVDGLGVPTVTLNSRHDLTKEEKRMGKKKLGSATVISPEGQVRRLLWHEEWRSHERGPTFTYNPQESPFDRLWQASWDFKNSRSWPPTTNPLLNLWEHIRLYIGLIANIQPASGKRKKTQAPLEEADVDDDDDAEVYVQGKDVALDRYDDPVEGLKIATDKKEQAVKENKTSGTWDEATREAFREKRDAKKDQRMHEFLYDTETAIKIFFSAHWRDKGLAWDKRKGEDCPILMGFFLRFLIWYNVFPEPEITRGLQRALTVCEKAQVELPATFVIAKALEDGVSKGLRQHFGTMTTFGRTNDDEDYTDNDDEEDDAVGEETGEPDAKRRKLDDTWTGEGINSINSSDINEATMRDAISDNVDVNGVEVAATGSWGSAWGEVSGTPVAWGDPSDAANGKAPALFTASEPDPPATDEWTTPDDPTLSRLLGETADLIPLTHTTGIVERSTRRIVKIVKPSETKGKSEAADGTAEAVEAEFESKLSCVVLAAWNKVGNHIASDVTTPVIQNSSRGNIIPMPGSCETPTEATTADAFDPFRDEIHVLLDPATCDKLTVNMGLTATWIQLARKAGDDKPEKRKDAKGKTRTLKKKGGPGKNGAPTKWWYMEQFMASLLSFHTDRYYPDQD